VTVNHLKQNETETIRARFVVGGDGGASCSVKGSTLKGLFLGAHSWVRKTMRIPVEGDNSGAFCLSAIDREPEAFLLRKELVWGALDFLPDSDLPDIHSHALVRSGSGAAIIIPRERGLLRLYVQLEGTNLLDAEGRVKPNSASAESLMEASLKLCPNATVTHDSLGSSCSVRTLPHEVLRRARVVVILQE
jgi:phenol 2-monooxygenase